MTQSIVIPDIDPDADTLTAALAYAAAGLYVGPVRHRTKSPGSVLGSAWQRLTSTDPQVVASWYAGTDHGIFIHAGRSGLLIHDVDDPEKLHPLVRRAIDETSPPYQTTRRGESVRGHYLYAMPPGRVLGNSTGSLGTGWGEVRGHNGVIIVAPSVHEDESGLYQWQRTGPVPPLPDYVAAELPDAMPSEAVATGAEVRAFLDAHTAAERPELVGIHAQGFRKRVETGESRHQTMTGHLAGAMREAAAGLVDARTAADTLESVFCEAVTKAPTSGKQGNARDRHSARDEWRGLLAWAVPQAKGADPAETRARVAERVPSPEQEEAAVYALAGAQNYAPEPAVDTETGQTPDEDAAARARRLFPRLDWHELWADDEAEEWIHEPLLPARRSVVVYSPPKVGKSLLMLEFAVALSRGETFLAAPIERRYRVLYVDYENDPRGDVRGRLMAMGYGPDDLDHLDYLSFPALNGLDTERGSLELLEAVKAYGAEVVVIDTVSRAVDGEENSNDTWLGLYRHTGLKLKQAGVSVVRLDHSGKDESKGQRGGSAKSGDVDMIWRLSKITDERFRLECTDARLPVETKSLHVIRQRLPRLTHTAEVLGALTDREAKIVHVIELADSNGLPADTGREAIRTFARERGIRARNDLFAEVAKRRKVAAEALTQGVVQPVPTLGDRSSESALSQGSGTGRDSEAEEPRNTGGKSCPQPQGTGGDNTPSPHLSPGQQSLAAPEGTAGQDEQEQAPENPPERCGFNGCDDPPRPGRFMCALHFTREPATTTDTKDATR